MAQRSAVIDEDDPSAPTTMRPAFLSGLVIVITPADTAI